MLFVIFLAINTRARAHHTYAWYEYSFIGSNNNYFASTLPSLYDGREYPTTRTYVHCNHGNSFKCVSIGCLPERRDVCSTLSNGRAFWFNLITLIFYFLIVCFSTFHSGSETYENSRRYDTSDDTVADVLIITMYSVVRCGDNKRVRIVSFWVIGTMQRRRHSFENRNVRFLITPIA